MTAHPDLMSCPADETLAAFIDGRLTGAARDAVVAHLAECGECRSLVMDATEFQAEEDEENNVVRPEFGRRRWPAFAAAAAVAAAVMVVYGPGLRERFLPTDIEQLAKADERSRYRPVQGRLSGDFVYHPHEGPKRGPIEEDPNSNHLLEAEALEIQLEKSPDAHALGLSYVVLGERDKAIAALRSALQSARGEKRTAVANDLAAALISQGVWNNDRGLVEEALRITENELRTKRTPELLWNRALALQKLGRTAEARQAWKDYLAVDSTSPWAKEALENSQRDDPY
jgi:tetratricopeptide (TPR) repeat protein